MIPPRVLDKLHELRSGEPLAAYVYDLAALDAHCAAIMASLPENVEFFYAAKANAELPILQTLAPRVHGFEAASGGELAYLREHFPEQPLIFGGPGKTGAELAAALAGSLAAIHVESLWELQQLAEMATAPVPLLLRLNPELRHSGDSPMLMGGKPTPFGMSDAELPQAARILQSSSWLDCRGFHLHTRSLQLDVDDHLRLIEGYLDAAPRWAASTGIDLRELNVGGGIGVNYRSPEDQFGWGAFCAGLQKLARPCTLRFECGRFVTAFCGYYAVEVLDIKTNHGETFAICRGGTHHFRLPAAQAHSHPFVVVPGPRTRGPSARGLVNVVGQLCTPKDRLASGALVEQVHVGDLLVFPLAGAYAWNISHHDFLMHPHPQQHFLPC